MASSTQNKTAYKSKGLRKSSIGPKKQVSTLTKTRYLQLLSQGGNKLRHNQLELAMVSALVSPKSNLKTAKFVVSVFN